MASGTVVVVAFAGWQLSWALTSASPRTLAKEAQATEAYGKLPLSFEANRGQTDSRVKFISRGAGYTLFLTPQESVLSLRKPARNANRGGRAKGARSALAPESVATVRMRLEGANPDPQIVGLKRLGGQANYLTGRDPEEWRTGVPSYASALYRDVYRGVDLVYHGKQGQLEYDFRVAPGGDPGRIALRFSGARDVSLDRRGNLLLDTPAGAVRQEAPVIYQQIGGRRRAVSGRFVLTAGHRVGFRVGSYDRSRTLVIDPTLVYSTYLGGGGATDSGQAVAVDSAGSAYVTGTAGSVDFPTKNALQAVNRGVPDVFVSKLTPDGTALAYSTFLGGGGTDLGLGIAVDGSGAAYVTGSTSSTNFPVINAFQSSCAGTSCADGYVAKVKPDGSGLVYSTYLGGDQVDTSNAVAVDSAGAAYVTGLTGSSGSGASTTSFPLANAAQPTYGGGGGDAFLTKLAPNDGTSAVALAYSTFLGGSATGGGRAEEGNGIALDPSGAAYVSGTTSSANFPTTAGAYDTTCGTATTTCDGNRPDGFVTKYTAAGTVVYSTFLGGGGFEQGFGIAVSRSASDAGTVYVVGQTGSADYPTTAGAYDRACGTTPPPSGTACTSDAFVTKLNAAGSGLVYSTYLGGQSFESTNEGVPGIAVNGAGHAFVGGYTQSSDFPIVRPVAEAGSGGYVAEFNSGGSDLVFSTFVGGGASSVPSGMALDSSGNAYVTGSTLASDFPTLSPIQPKLAGGGRRDAFVAKLSPASDANLAAPYVLGVSPKGGDVSGGRQVKITGTGLGGVSAVAFGGVPAASFTVDSPTQITAVSPARAPGPAAVTVTTGQGPSPPNPISRFVYGEGMFASTVAAPPFAGGNGMPTTALLKTGKVLVVARGGSTAAALYDPKSGTFTPTGSLISPESFSTATLLPSGKVLGVGGSRPEIYDPATGTFTRVADLPLFNTNGGTATLLKTSKVLVTGGSKQAQLYDPATDSFSVTIGSPIDDHSGGQTALLPDGKVLLAGGPGQNFDASRSAELYDPSTEAFTRTGTLNTARYAATLTPLPNGKVLAAGGAAGVSGETASAELYDPQTGDWTVTGSLDDFRRFHAATLLPNGKVLIVGGTAVSAPVSGAELFDPAARGGLGGFISAGRAEDRIGRAAAVLLSSDPGGFGADPAVCGGDCGKVLAVGFGSIVSGSSSQAAWVAELYTPLPAPPGPGLPGPGPTGDGAGAGSTSSGATTSTGMPSTGTPTSTGTPDTRAPDVSRFAVTNRRFVVDGGSTSTFGSAAKAKKSKKGTAFKYALSEAGTARIVISERRSGRRKGTRCVASGRSLRKAAKCTLIMRKGTLTRISRAGANQVAFSGRIGSKALSPGSYSATITATDAAKNTSKPKTVSLTIVRR